GQIAIVASALGVLALGAWALRHLRAGRAVYAVGSDAEAARLAGIEPSRVVITVFVVMGALSGLAALLNAVRFSSIPSHMGLGRANAFEVARLGVEVGLLALAMTAVIVTGGIDLSVGSMMGLAAVVLGALWRDAHWPIAAAVLAALLAGAAGGALNAVMIAR